MTKGRRPVVAVYADEIYTLAAMMCELESRGYEVVPLFHFMENIEFGNITRFADDLLHGRMNIDIMVVRCERDENIAPVCELISQLREAKGDVTLVNASVNARMKERNDLFDTTVPLDAEIRAGVLGEVRARYNKI